MLFCLLLLLFSLCIVRVILLSLIELRVVIGITELILGTLIFVPAFRRISAAGVVILMSGAVYTHTQLNEPFYIAAVCLTLAILTIIVSGKKHTPSASKKKQ